VNTLAHGLPSRPKVRKKLGIFRSGTLEGGPPGITDGLEGMEGRSSGDFSTAELQQNEG
jgi:hypothetical protein